VFGIPDEEFGESLAAHIELEPGSELTAESVRDHVRRSLAGYKVPGSWSSPTRCSGGQREAVQAPAARAVLGRLRPRHLTRETDMGVHRSRGWTWTPTCSPSWRATSSRRSARRTSSAGVASSMSTARCGRGPASWDCCAPLSRGVRGGGGTFAHEAIIALEQVRALAPSFGGMLHSGIIAHYLNAYGTTSRSGTGYRGWRPASWWRPSR